MVRQVRNAVEAAWIALLRSSGVDSGHVAMCFSVAGFVIEKVDADDVHWPLI